MMSGNLGQPSPLIAIDSGCSHSLEELAHQDDFRSSDIEIEAPKFNQYADLGIRSIASSDLLGLDPNRLILDPMQSYTSLGRYLAKLGRS